MNLRAPNSRTEPASSATPRSSIMLRSVCEVPPAPVAAPPAGTAEVCAATRAPQSAGEVAAQGQRRHEVTLLGLGLGAERRRVEAVHDDDAGVALDRRDRGRAERDRPAVVNGRSARCDVQYRAGGGRGRAAGRQRRADVTVEGSAFGCADNAVAVRVGGRGGARSLGADVDVLHVGIRAARERRRETRRRVR